LRFAVATGTFDTMWCASALVVFGLVGPSLAESSVSSRVSSESARGAGSVALEADILRFDSSEFLSLQPGQALPSAFETVAGAGLRLVARRGVGDGQHLLFEDPAHPAREASLLVRAGRVTGTVSRKGTLRTVVDGVAAGVSRTRVIDAGSELPCGFDPSLRIAHQHDADDSAGGVAGGCDDGSTVDVFVGYTGAAEAQAGGATAMGDWILWAVADSNAIYASSGIPITLRLLGTMKTAGNENGAMVDDLYQLRDPEDGAFDDVLAAGAAAGADLISLTRADGGGACGIAFLIGGSTDDVDWAVSVTALGCYTNKTFTHELGHNMGCCHAPGDGGGCFDGGVFPYSTGHRFDGQDGQLYRTVMAYAPGTRIGRFSSPTVLFEGTPTGIADERDNARTIQETRFNVANFRCPPCAGDFDGSGVVDGADLAIMLGGWGDGSIGGDLNNDGSTDGADLAILLGAWGSCN
jgi:hypothetical protein